MIRPPHKTLAKKDGCVARHRFSVRGLHVFRCDLMSGLAPGRARMCSRADGAASPAFVYLPIVIGNSVVSVQLAPCSP